jgi:hypothetical protein
MMGERVDQAGSDGGRARGPAGLSSRDGVLQRAFAVFMALGLLAAMSDRLVARPIRTR